MAGFMVLPCTIPGCGGMSHVYSVDKTYEKANLGKYFCRCSRCLFVSSLAFDIPGLVKKLLKDGESDLVFVFEGEIFNTGFQE